MPKGSENVMPLYVSDSARFLFRANPSRPRRAAIPLLTDVEISGAGADAGLESGGEVGRWEGADREDADSRRCIAARNRLRSAVFGCHGFKLIGLESLLRATRKLCLPSVSETAKILDDDSASEAAEAASRRRLSGPPFLCDTRQKKSNAAEMIETK